jgi:hypothetical protein
MWKTWKSQKKSNQTVTFSIRLSPRLTLTLAAVLRGWGERKDEKSRLSGGWNRRWVSRSDDFRLVVCVVYSRYLYVVEPGYLHFRREVEEERVSAVSRQAADVSGPVIDLSSSPVVG